MATSTCNDTVLESLVKQLRLLIVKLAADIQADIITIHVYDALEARFDMPIGNGLLDKPAFERPANLPTLRQAAGKIVTLCQEIVAGRVEGDPLFDGPFALRERVISAAGFPLLLDGTALGALFVSYRSAHTFTSSDKACAALAAREAAALVHGTDAIAILRANRHRVMGGEQRSIQAVARLAYQLTGSPVGVLVFDEAISRVTLRALAGFESPFALHDIVADSVDDAVYRITIAELESMTSSTQDAGFGRRYALCMPVHVGHRAVASVLACATTREDLDNRLRPVLQQIAELAAVAIEGEQRSSGAHLLSEIIQELGAAADLSTALQIACNGARALTGADTAGIFLRDSRTRRFLAATYSPPMADPSLREPRIEGGLTQHIIETRESIVVPDTTLDSRVQQEIRREGVLSLIGVPVRRGDVLEGALYANSKRTNHFSDNHRKLLETLAAQVSVGLGWIRRVLDPAEDVQRATENLFRLDEILNKFSARVKRELGFDYLNVQLVRPAERVIEKVYGTETTPTWSGPTRQPLDRAPGLLDIQADIATADPPRMESITGWDDRFSRWTYEKFGHEQLSRFWLPILCVRNSHGAIVGDWHERALWRRREEVTDGGRRICYELDKASLFEGDTGAPIECIGTLEAVYRDPTIIPSDRDVRRLCAMTAECALSLRQTLLPYVLEVVAENARQIAGADSATVHFDYDEAREKYAYEACSKNMGFEFLNAFRPRAGGLGQMAISQRKPKWIPDSADDHGEDQLQRLNLPIWNAGIRAIAAFPLIAGNKHGVLYVHFNQTHRFTPDEVAWLGLFARLAVHAIRRADQYMESRDSTRQLDYLRAIASDLVSNAGTEDLLERIAWGAIDSLAADVTCIYEYVESENLFPAEPTIAGRLLQAQEVYRPSDPEAPRVSLLRHGSPVYAQNARENEMFSNAQGTNRKGAPNFVVRENIVSAAGIPIRAGSEMVGVMFINYRTPHRFTERDRVAIESLSSSAAIAISNRRALGTIQRNLLRRTQELDALKTIDNAIVQEVPEIDGILKLILLKALEVTQAPYGCAMWHNKLDNILELKAQAGEMPGPSFEYKQRFEDGVVGQAARTQHSVLVPDVTHEQWRHVYLSVMEPTRSELAVPLKDDKGLLGVLNLEHSRTGGFTPDDRTLVETLAVQAVIAVHASELYKELQRQIKPLRALSSIATAIQQKRRDLRAALHLILTGVTAEEGLAFSRAMLFLLRERHVLRGHMGIGALTREEAETTWIRLREGRERHSRDGELTALLKDWQEEGRPKQLEDQELSRLNTAVQRFTVPLDSRGGAVAQSLNKGEVVVQKYGDEDLFGKLMQTELGMDRGSYAYACVPLRIRGDVIGVMVVDNRFLLTERDSNFDLATLETYANVVAMTIENARLDEQLERQRRLETLEQTAGRASHITSKRLTAVQGAFTRTFVDIEQELTARTVNAAKVLELLKQSKEMVAERTRSMGQLLLDMTKYSMPLKPRFPRRIDIAQLVRGLVSEKQRGSCNITCALPDDAVIVLGDRDLLRDVFEELIANALEAMRTDGVGSIYISMSIDGETRANASNVRIEVSDTGPGVLDRDKTAIFDPFITNNFTGTGLGLAIVRKILEGHEGAIEERGECGNGACFSIVIPLARETDERIEV